jgi:CRISPR-associated protein Csb1
MSHARHSVVLSLAGLRRLRFTTDVRGEVIPDDRRDGAEIAARTALAALALAGVVYQREQGYDLRSRSLLVPTEPLAFELLSANGGEPQRFTLDRASAAALVTAAAGAAAEFGLGWEAEPIRLQPTPKLAHLVRKSRELTAAGEAEGDE